MKYFQRVCHHLLWTILSLALSGFIIVGALYAYFYQDLPDTKTLNDIQMQVPLRVYSADGKLMGQYGTKRRIPVDFNQVPPILVHAILATEDQRYYQHSGVDLIGVVRAAKSVISSGRKSQGASTITMQVARNFFLSDKKTYSRKLKEMMLAMKIDREYSKQRILELYLNKVYFGKRAYGVAAAAQVYYGRDLNKLDLAQMSMLAGLPQSPSRNNPINRPKAAIARRNHVIDRLLDENFINQQQHDAAIKEPLTASYHARDIQVSSPYVAEMVRSELYKNYGPAAYTKGLTVYTTINSKDQAFANQALLKGLVAYDHRHGYRAVTKNLGQPDPNTLTDWQNKLKKIPAFDTLLPAAILEIENQSAQALLANGSMITIPWAGMSWARPRLNKNFMGPMPKTASDILKAGDVIRVMQLKNGQWELDQVPQVEGALVSVDPKDGALLALAGGLDFDDSNFNRAVQAQRQPGSAFKPFIYSAAINKGYTLANTINDAPIVMKDSGENQLWRPNNDTMKFYGPTRLRVGLIQSRNLVSIRLLQSIGVPYTLDYIQRFGFDPKTLPNTLSLALGSGAVTPLQLAMGYTVFANGGYKVNPYYVSQISDEDGKTIYQFTPQFACEKCLANPNLPKEQIPQPAAPRVITADNAYLIDSALQSVIQQGTGRAAKVLKRNDLAGKTGTTNKQADGWFSGFNQNLVTTVWVGFDNLQSLNEYGAKAALPIWIDYMGNALAKQPLAAMPQPQNIVTVRINKDTGLRSNSSDNNTMFEVFRKNHVPAKMTASTQNPYQNSNNTQAKASDNDDSGSNGNSAITNIF